MLAAMGERSFVVTIAYIKTEPVQVALFGLIFLGDRVTPLIGRRDPDRDRRRDRDVAQARRRQCQHHALDADRAWRPARMFALSAIGYRGAILSLHLPDFVLAATFTLAVGLVLQAVLLSLYLALRDPGVLQRHRRAPGGRRCSPASWARSPRNSGSSPSRSPPRPACARWRWSRCCSRRRSRSSCSSSRPRGAKRVGIVLVVIGVALLVWA